MGVGRDVKCEALKGAEKAISLYNRSCNDHSPCGFSSVRPEIYHDPDFTNPKTDGSSSSRLTATSSQGIPCRIRRLPPLSRTRRHPNGGARTAIGIERQRYVLWYPAGWSSCREHRWRPPARTPALRPLLRRHFGLISRALPPPMTTPISVPFAMGAFVTMALK